MTGVPKYHFVNGVMQMNPAWRAQAAAAGGGGVGAPHSQPHPNALAVVASLEDAQHASALHEQAHGRPMQFAPSTQASVEIMQDDGYLRKFQSPAGFQPGEVLEKLTQNFAQYEVPLGLINKLTMLSEYSLNLIVDDSGSMNNTTDSNTTQTGDYMKKKFYRLVTPQGQHMVRQMTRWEEAEDRVHTLIDLLTYVPTGPIHIGFLNRADRVHLNREGKTPEQFAADAHRQVERAFQAMPRGQTPTKHALQQAFASSPPNTMHYLFTDGEPSDTMEFVDVDEDGNNFRRYPEIEQIVTHRRNPRAHPLTFVSCTGDDAEAEWMKVLEEAAPYAAELDDFVAEAREVHHNQGPYFPFTKGFWLICLLAAAINPDDLDAMDEHAPFSKMTLDNLLGRVTTEQDYVHYFRSHPQEPVVRAYYQEFATAQATGKQIWGRHGLKPLQKVPAPVGAAGMWGAQSQAQPSSYGAYGMVPAAMPAASAYGAPIPPGSAYVAPPAYPQPSAPPAMGMVPGYPPSPQPQPQPRAATGIQKVLGALLP